jgi:actin-related protein
MASFYNGDNVQAVVADLGHYSTKIGWAGDDYPRSYFRSVSNQVEDDDDVA